MSFSLLAIYGILTVIATMSMVTPGQVDHFVQMARTTSPEFQEIPSWFIVTVLAMVFTLVWPILAMATLFDDPK